MVIHSPPWETSFQGVLESDKISSQPPFLQGKQPQLPQSLFMRLVLQTLPRLCCPPSDTLQHLKDLRLWWLSKEMTRGTSVCFVFFSVVPKLLSGIFRHKAPADGIFSGVCYTLFIILSSTNTSSAALCQILPIWEKIIFVTARKLIAHHLSSSI